jgi:hypothetical protein
VQDRAVLRSASYDLGWRLVATSGTLLWSYDLRGTYQQPQGEPFNPARELGREPEVRPFGGAAPTAFRDLADLVRALHFAAMSRLPRR